MNLPSRPPLFVCWRFLSTSLLTSFALIVLALAFPAFARAQATPLMTGIVTDSGTGQPLANATVFFYGSAYGTVSTDSTGRYTFTNANLTLFGGAISGVLYVGATGYFEAVPVSVGNLGALPVVNNFALLAGGTLIQGVVRDSATGAGIPGATIVFHPNPMSTFRGGTAGSVQTQSDGSYSIDSSYFNQSGLTSGFSASLQVNATNYLGTSASVNFTSYPQAQDFNLIQVNQSISAVTITGPGTYTGSALTPTYMTTPAGGTVSFSPATETNPGTYTLNWFATGNFTGSGTASWTIMRSQTITFGNPGTQTYGTSLTLRATASSGLPVFYTVASGSATITGNILAFKRPGPVTITASQPGNAIYSAAPPVSQTFSVIVPAYTALDLRSSLGAAQGYAEGLNASGAIVGGLTTGGGTLHAFVYSKGVLEDINSALGGVSSIASGINKSGAIVGQLTTASGASHAFVERHGKVQDISGAVGGVSSSALGINSRGAIVGQLTTVFGGSDAFVDINGSVKDINASLGGTSSIASGITDAGTVVGQLTALSGVSHAFLDHNGQVRDLGTLGGTTSAAYGINNFGAVVGSSQTAGGSAHAFIYAFGKMNDLNALVNVGTVALTEARGINDKGQIIAWGSNGDDYLLTPVSKR